VPFATQVAYGRPETCPDDAVADVYGDGSPSPMDLRCSYADGTGSVLARVRGRVLLEGPPGSPGESPGRMTVVLVRAPKVPGDPFGPELAHAVTDPQGAFSMGAMLRGGELVLQVYDAEDGGGRPLVERRITMGGDAGYRLDDVRLVIPRPMDEPSEPSEPSSEPSEPSSNEAAEP